ncbi:MAG: hypothetical protein EP329_09020 [Deltaproteobacteria bacterium]|nr:MAG: hypothetical protein EP329_09020 [Deltaproteobacteria bacterium]
MSTGEDDQKKVGATGDADAADTGSEAVGDGAAGADDPWPFDEDGVFRIRPREEIDLSPFTVDEPAPADGELSFSSGDELTLDAFEKAVSRKIHERFAGDGAPEAEAEAEAPATTPQGADELVASMLGALTGKDARTALDEVRAKLAAGPEAPPAPEERGGAEVIDLAAAREKRQQKEPSEAATRVGGVLMDTVNAFLEDYARKAGKSEVQIDATFLKTHGNALLGNLFQGLAQALLPQLGKAMSEAGVSLPKGVGPVDVDELARWEAEAEARKEAGETESAGASEIVSERAGESAGVSESAEANAEADASAQAEAEADVGARRPGKTDLSIKVDLGSILANLFARRPKS